LQRAATWCNVVQRVATQQKRVATQQSDGRTLLDELLYDLVVLHEHGDVPHRPVRLLEALIRLPTRGDMWR
jgi:hypothetical protein